MKTYFFGKRTPKKGNSPRCKVNTLACYMSFEPYGSFNNIWVCVVKVKIHKERMNWCTKHMINNLE